jgi:hypothetical protein
MFESCSTTLTLYWGGVTHMGVYGVALYFGADVKLPYHRFAAPCRGPRRPPPRYAPRRRMVAPSAPSTHGK